MRIAMNRFAPMLLPILLLGACKDEVPAESPEDARRKAEGEVLGGTISDDMLPLDRLQSQSPPLDGDGESGAGGEGGDDADSGDS